MHITKWLNHDEGRIFHPISGNNGPPTKKIYIPITIVFAIGIYLRAALSAKVIEMGALNRSGPTFASQEVLSEEAAGDHVRAQLFGVLASVRHLDPDPIRHSSLRKVREEEREAPRYKKRWPLHYS